MHGVQRRTLAGVTALVMALALSGCATAGAGSSAETAASTPSASAAPTTPPAATPDAMAAEPEQTAEPAPAAGAYLDYADGLVEQTAGDKALFFHATWCPKCRALDEELRTVGAPDGLTVFKVDFDSRTDLRQRYEVPLQTTIVFVDDAGEKISSVVLYEDPSVASLEAARP